MCRDRSSIHLRARVKCGGTRIQVDGGWAGCVRTQLALRPRPRQWDRLVPWAFPRPGTTIARCNREGGRESRKRLPPSARFPVRDRRLNAGVICLVPEAPVTKSTSANERSWVIPQCLLSRSSERGPSQLASRPSSLSATTPAQGLPLRSALPAPGSGESGGEPSPTADISCRGSMGFA